MNELVPIATGVASYLTVDKVAKSVEEFVTAYLGHKGESIPTIFGETLRRRKENAEKVINKAHLTLLEIGMTMKDFKEIPLDVAEPIIEGASRTEDDELRDRWAYLLANAGDPRASNSVLPVFASMLKDLSSREVKFLDEVSKHRLIRRGLSMRELQETFTSARLALLPTPAPVAHFPEQEILDEKDKPGFAVMLDILLRGRILIATSKSEATTFTELGWAFVKACQPPKS